MSSTSTMTERDAEAGTHGAVARQLVRDALAADILEELRLEPVVFGSGHSRFQHSRSMADEVARPEIEEEKKPRMGLSANEIAGLGQRLRA